MPLALTGWEIGLLSTAVVFIILALVASMVVPRSRPEFPSRYLGWFIAGCIVLFVGQMTAVILLAEVGEEHEAAAETEPGGTETEPTETEPTETEPTETEPTETEPTETTETETEPGETTEPPPGGGGSEPVGRQIFVDNCASCHTLADAGTSGTIGPNLDEAQPPVELAVDRVTNGQGVMPSFSGTLTEEQIQEVATYVAAAAGG